MDFGFTINTSEKFQYPKHKKRQTNSLHSTSITNIVNMKSLYRSRLVNYIRRFICLSEFRQASDVNFNKGVERESVYAMRIEVTRAPMALATVARDRRPARPRDAQPLAFSAAPTRSKLRCAEFPQRARAKPKLS